MNKDLKKVFLKLKNNDIKLVSVESITGGNFSKKITQIPGASSFFLAGLVTYSNQAKKTILSISEQDLAKYGAVSSQTAKRMLEGAKKLFPQAKLIVSFTGNAGPIVMENKDVGKSYIGIFYQNQYNLFEYDSKKSERKKIIEDTINFAFKKILELID